MSENTPHIPQHIAIIMDGNGRWASARGLPRLAGHRAGVEAVKRTVEAVKELGIPYLTLYSFSSENWQRPQKEVDELMNLLRRYLKSETAQMHKNNVRLVVIGDRSKLADDIVELVENTERLTKDNTALTVCMALSYGSQDEIVQAAKRLASQCAAGELKVDAINREVFSAYLDTAGIPDPDILIRTSGEVRLSNFLLWQCAYTELVFLDTLWPDFNKSDLEGAIADFKQRERRYGRVSEIN